MNGIFRYISGVITVRVVSAESGEAISQYARMGIRLDAPTIIDPLTFTVRVPASQWQKLKELAEKRGDRCILLRQRGLLFDIRKKRHRIPFLMALCALLAFALYASTRLCFLRVEGNETVPTGEILAVAEECGLTFWSRVKDIRSEQFKNLILNEIPELQWAGVNFSGGVATISVRERLETEEIRQTNQIANVVASRDGVILSVSVLGGQSLCEVGQAVTAGEILVTGCIEHEYQTQYTCADAEIYALTQRELEGVYPQIFQSKRYTSEKTLRVELICGRKKIKIYGNSGILGTSCDKMITVKHLTLPGGFVLPVSLVVETCRAYDTEPVFVESQAGELVSNYLRDYVLDDMIAGEILNSTPTEKNDGELYRLGVTYSCREMIARQWTVTLFESENTNDRTNRERGESGGSD